MMKKYIFGVLFFLGCFFMCLSTNVGLVEAASIATTVTPDAYNGRNISIKLDGLSIRTSVIKVHEVELCQYNQEDGETCEGYEEYVIDADTYYIKSLNTVEYEASGQMSETINYTVVSQEDGDKKLLIESYYNRTLLANTLITYTLSTLNQRVVINPDAQGNSLHVYDNVQYTAVRKINISITLTEDENKTYSGLVYICELLNEKLENCGDYVLSGSSADYYIQSFSDGLKYINFYLITKGNSITSTEELLAANSEKFRLISKNIYLDTVGPEITFQEGGQWMYVEAGSKYTAQKATCQDAIFSNATCVVTNDLDVVRINYNTDKYQIVTYEATDLIGNVSSVAVKIKVEIAEEENNLTTILLVSVAVVVVTGLVLGYFLIKSHEKKKKISYI